MQKAVCYTRVSTGDQHPEVQENELRRYVKSRGWKLYRVYEDRGVSGATEKRPALNRMMADAHRRQFDVLVVWKFDRFARSVSHLLRALETFNALGTEFVSLSEQVDTSTPTGKMIFTVLGSVSEIERSLIGERVRAGIQHARSLGKRLGRPPLRVLSASDVSALRRERARTKAPFRTLAKKYGISIFTAHKLCARGN